VRVASLNPANRRNIPCAGPPSSWWILDYLVLNQLSPDTRKTLAETFAAIKPNLDDLIDRVLGIPGVGAIIKPTVDAIRAKIDTLATT
jgi:hypothetical protein